MDVVRVARVDCTEARLRSLIEDLPAGRVLALSSQVLLGNGTIGHLPMLDFHCHESLENDILVRNVLHELGLNGYVAKSGKSYHFYANSLVDETTLLYTLGRSLLFS